MPAELKLVRTPAEEALIARFAAESPALPGGPVMREARAAAFDVVKRRGLPNRRVEAFKYTDLKAAMASAPSAPPAPSEAEVAAADAAIPALGLEAETRVLFVGGVPSGRVAMPAGISFENLTDRPGGFAEQADGSGAAAMPRDDIIVALNTAFLADGVVIRVEPGARIEAPLHLAFVDKGDTPFAATGRVILDVGAGATLTIVESHAGPTGLAYQTNTLVELALGEGASVEHVRLDAAGDEALVLSTLAVTLAKDATLSTLAFTTGGAVTRNQVFARYEGEGAKAAIRAATLLRGRQHVDNTLVIDHAHGHGESRELFRSVIDGEATGVFQGKIIVAPHAQKTDGRMASNALLLSDGATMNNKPELEIFADDVQCAHGATCGALDENQLFYIMARGVPRKEAEALLVAAFVGEVLESVSHEGLRAAFEARVATWLAERA